MKRFLIRFVICFIVSYLIATAVFDYDYFLNHCGTGINWYLIHELLFWHWEPKTITGFVLGITGATVWCDIRGWYD